MAHLQQDLGPEFEALSLPDVLKKPTEAHLAKGWRARFQRWVQFLRHYG